MKNTPCILLSILVFSSQARAAEPIPAFYTEGERIWIATAGASANSTADKPDYANKAVWPLLDGREAFTKTEWPAAARVVAWAIPGQSGREREANPYDLANWTVNGKPAGESVSDIEELFGPDVDVIFPSAPTPYIVDIREGSHGHETMKNQVFRHITVGENATFKGGGDGIGRKILGNIWVKRNGNLQGQGSMHLIGDQSTFVRNDNEWVDMLKNPKVNSTMISQYIRFAKEGGVSTEFLGASSVLDEFAVVTGTLIVGRDSRLETGRNADPVIEKEGTLAILDGGYLGKWQNDFGSRDMEVKGSLQGGLENRPLMRNAFLGISFKNHTAAGYTGEGVPTKEGKPVEFPRVAGLVVSAGAQLRAFSAPGKNAVLVVTAAPEMSSSLRPIPGSERESATLRMEPDSQAFWKWYEQLPRGIDVFIAQDARVENVQFNFLRGGGILTPDPAVAANWKNVTFGPNCFGTPADRFTTVEPLNKSNQY